MLEPVAIWAPPDSQLNTVPPAQRLLLAFTTRSSEVTLPVHMKILQEMGIPNKIVSVVAGEAQPVGNADRPHIHRPC
jgi:L-cystine uptake protein TcyP (sodium:dicarboxylate symporter family)